MKEKEQIKSGVVLSYVYLVLSIVIGLVYSPIMLEQMGQSEYGLYTIAKSVMSYLGIMGLGLSSSLTRFSIKFITAGDKKNESLIYGTFIKFYSVICVATIVIGTAAAFVLMPLYESKLSADEISTLRILIIILSVNLGIGFPLSVFKSITIAYERFNYQKILSIVTELVNPLLTLAVLFFGFRSIGVVVVISVISLASGLIDMQYSLKKLKIKILFGKIQREVVREIAGYTGFIFIGLVTDRIADATNSLVLGAVCGTIEVSIYGIAMQVFTYYNNFSASISNVLTPKIMKLTFASTDTKLVSDMFTKVGRIQFYILSIMFVGFTVLGRQFISVWLGSDYAMSYYVALFLMGPTMFSRSQNLGPVILQAKNKIKFRAIIYLIMSVFDVIISIWLSKFFGSTGAAAGTAIATVTGPIIIMNFYYKHVIGLDIKKYWVNIAPIFLIDAVFIVGGLFLFGMFDINSWGKFFISGSVFAVIFIVVLYFTVMNEYEKDLIVGILRKFKHKKA